MSVTHSIERQIHNTELEAEQDSHWDILNCTTATTGVTGFIFCTTRSTWSERWPSGMKTRCVSTCWADGATRWDRGCWLCSAHLNSVSRCVCVYLYVCVCADCHAGLAGEEGSCCPLQEPPHSHALRRPGELPQGTGLLPICCSLLLMWSVSMAAGPSRTVNVVLLFELSGGGAQSRFLQDSEALHRQGKPPGALIIQLRWDFFRLQHGQQTSDDVLRRDIFIPSHHFKQTSPSYSAFKLSEWTQQTSQPCCVHC